MAWTRFPLGVGQDVALAAFEFLAGVIAAGAATQLARRHQQSMVQRLPQPVVAPQVKPAPDGRHRQKTRWQHPPRPRHAADTGSPPQSAASASCGVARQKMPVAETAPAASIRHQSNHLAKPGPRGLHVREWCQSTSSVFLKFVAKPQNQRSGATSSQPADTTQLNFGSGSWPLAGCTRLAAPSFTQSITEMSDTVYCYDRRKAGRWPVLHAAGAVILRAAQW